MWMNFWCSVSSRRSVSQYCSHSLSPGFRQAEGFSPVTYQTPCIESKRKPSKEHKSISLTKNSGTGSESVSHSFGHPNGLL